MILTDEIRNCIKNQLTARPAAPIKENVQVRRAAGAWVRPHASEALAVNPEDVPEAMAYLRSRGIAAEFDGAGRCLVTSDKQFRDIARANGMYDGRDGYGVRDNEGNRILTGREQARGREEFKRAVARGDFDI